MGNKDNLSAGNKQLSAILTQYDVTNTFELYNGDHTNRIAARVETKVLPFFSNHLSFTAAKH